jgi:hypothetical protein
VVERGVRTDQRWVEGVEAGGGKPGSNGRARRSLDVDMPSNVEPAKRRNHDNNIYEDCRDGKSGEVLRRGDPQDQPPPEHPVRRD